MLSDTIRAVRKRNFLSQAQFAKKIGVTQGSVSQWENGLTRPNSDQLRSISTIFNVSVDELLKEERSDNQSILSEKSERADITDEDIRFALSGGEEPISKAQFEEVKQFVRFIRERDKSNGNK